MRDLGNDPDKNPKWILLDGDLDANWIESMNSVMDDNKILTLPSNERITLYPHMRLIFEIRDLKHATPATSSRAGILYISDDAGYQWRCMVKAWITSRKEEDGYDEATKTELTNLFEAYIGPTLFQIKKEFFTIIPIVDVQAVETMFHLLAGLLTDEVIKGELRPLLETYIVFACVWAFGSPLFTKDNVSYKKEFSAWWKAEFKNVKFPSRGEVFDYFVDTETKKFESWAKIVPVVEYSSEMEMSSITVPTPETVSVDFMCDILLPRRNPVMLVGEAGTGKTQQLTGKLRKMQEESDGDYVFSTICFNYYSDSGALQEILEQSLEKKAGINFGPKGKAKLIYFVDDLNMPQLDDYMTQTSISLMRTHFDYQHWYDRNKFTLKNIHNCQWVSAMNPTAGSSTVNPRLQRWYMVFAVELPGGESLYAIYNTFLEGHLKTFPEELQKLGSSLIRGALTVQTQVMQTFRKTAVNFHYEFNIRHLTRVFTGLLGSRPEQFKDPDKFVRMWMHESERVYGDILVSYEHLAMYQKLSQGVTKKLFPNVSVDRFYAKENPDPLIYCHFAEGDLTDKLYDEVLSFDALGTILNNALKEYNEINAVMDLVLFIDAMKHICRVTRVINNSGGHALLVGVGGMGKQSLSRLSSFVCGYTTVQIQISQAYTITSSPGLKEDIRTMYTKAGLKDEGICFLFTDAQIADEKFLVYLNDLLSSGDIPGLFMPDEKENVINSVRSRVKAAGIPETPDNCWRFFIQTVQQNLHMCLCFSPVGEDMSRRARRFPALINCTSIDWFQDWPQSALLSVTQKFMSNVEGGLGDEDVTESVIKFMPWSFELVNKVAKDFKAGEKRDVYTTPKSFLELLNFYKTMLLDKRNETNAAIERLDTGLTKLLETSAAVGVMEEELKVKSVEVAEKKEKAEGIAEVVGKEKAIVDEQAAAAAVEGEKCDAIASEASEIQASAEKDLEKAEPAVREAEAALDTLDKKELGECKGMAKPPGGVDDVFSSILVLLANAGGASDIATTKKGMPKDLSWKAAQLLMKDVVAFIARLKGVKALIDTDQVPKVNFEHIRSYLALDYFTVEIIKKKSNAAAGCCAFVIAIVTYYDIVVTVEPKRQALREATDKLNKAQAELEVINAEVAELQAKLKILVDQFDEADATKTAAIAESDACEKKLNLAQRLVAALASEKVRWAESIEELKTGYGLLTGDCLLAAAFVSYVGPFTKPYRTRLIEGEMAPWMQTNNIPMGEAVDPLKVMVDASEVAGWASEGLPNDPVSVENGTIVTRCTRYPVMIDPQLQGIAWIKERESKRNLQVTRLTAKDLINVMERSIQDGHSVLIENMGEQIEPVLSNVVGRRLFKKGRTMYVQLGDKEVPFNDEFQLFLHTKLSNPHYPPEVQAEATVINFSVTESGLEDQLLALVVCKERPDLEQQKAKLISDQNGFMIKMKELEDDLLHRLAHAEGDITEDVELIENLEESKRIATDIAEKQVIAAETEITINAAREDYRPTAARGALLFFLMVNLNKVHTFYQFSLNSYVAVFQRGIDLVSKPAVPKNPLLRMKMAVSRATKKFSWSVDVLKQARDGGDFGGGGVPVPKSPEELQERLGVLTESVQFTVVSYIRRGLFVCDKMTLATQVCLWVLRKNGDLPAEEVESLITGRQVDTGQGMSQILAEWLPESAWLGLQALKEIQAFAKLPDDMDSSPEMWKRWYDLEKPELVDMPKDYKNLDEWKKILVLRVVRPDRVTPAMSQFIKDRMGGRYIDEEAFNMRDCFNESSPSTPIFFVLFPGVDPTPDVERLGNELGFTADKGNYINISMGQGQEQTAEQSLDNFAKNGGWVFLQNVHLMSSWLPSLERKLEICAEMGHDDFRCFISAEPPMFAGMPAPMVKTIPESILQSCIKVANEAPVDAKANLRMAYANFSEEKWSPCGTDMKKVNDCKNCLFALCVFHTMLLGRKKYGFVGWSRVYPFNTGDLTISSDVMVSYIRDNPETPYADLRYIFGEIMYGGHITDPWDRRVDNNYLTVLIGEHTQEGFECMPGFPMPNPAENNYDAYRAYIEEKMPLEDPTMYGLHANAGIGNLLNSTTVLFDTIMTLQGAGGGGAGGSKMETVVGRIVEDYLERLPEDFNMFEIRSRITEKSPYVLVVLQEIEGMNVLLSEIRRSLIELQLGLQGALNMSAAMEELQLSLFSGSVPPGWRKVAYASLKGLVGWWADMVERVNQLTDWSDTLILPKSVWISGLFNANAFLTAVNQVTARREGLPLDTMDTLVDVTPVMEPSGLDGAEEDGATIHGLYMEGARWNSEEGCISESFLKDLHPTMPLLHVFSKQAPALENRLLHEGYYECPVFTCSTRGASNTNAIFGASIMMAENDTKERWISAAVCLLFSDD
jgi:dynein heavy chain